MFEESQCKFAASHEWAFAEGGVATVGISDHAQKEISDIVFVELPKVGDKIEAGRGPWIQSFAGKSLADPAPAQWAVKKDGGVFDQFAGATITPRAVVKAVRGGLEYFASHRDDILQEKQP